MKKVCAWCGKVLNEKDIESKDEKVSHGMCLDCFVKVMNEVKERLENIFDE